MQLLEPLHQAGSGGRLQQRSEALVEVKQEQERGAAEQRREEERDRLMFLI